MELWRELLINALQNKTNNINYINDSVIKNIIDSECYKILLQIKQTINNDNLSDEECFYKIERLICLLEENNLFCNRHDFG